MIPAATRLFRRSCLAHERARLVNVFTSTVFVSSEALLRQGLLYPGAVRLFSYAIGYPPVRLPSANAGAVPLFGLMVCGA